MPRIPRTNSREPSQRSVSAVGGFIRFVGALEDGRLRLASREQAKLRQLGFDVTVRPFGPPRGIGGELKALDRMGI